ncbi:PIN domain-containing protein [Streptomyces sp. NPDC001698]|uniref:PIN domain-containing protein n=1 Tax=Streptomyces sp. NPDC001698 TaxID=3364601 RepID=UPI003694B125
MIILDTCVIEGMSLSGSSAELLQVLQRTHTERVGIPWPAMQELVAHKVSEYREAHEAATAAFNQLNRRTPWQEPQPLRAINLDNARGHWWSEFSDLAETVPISQEGLEEALIREANTLPPCKTVGAKKVKVGGRDAAIWLSAVEFAKDHPDETVYFVSGNTSGFTDGTDYPEIMQRDLRSVRDRFIHLTALDDVVSRFAQPYEVPAAEAQKTLIRSGAGEEVRRSMTEWYRRVRSRIPQQRFGVMVEPAAPSRHTAVGWWDVYTPHLDELDEVQGYRIGEHTWCMATTRWIVPGVAQLASPSVPVVAACAWKLRLLFTLQERSQARVTILRSTQPEALSADSDIEAFSLLAEDIPPEIPRDPYPADMTDLEPKVWARGEFAPYGEVL